MTSSEKILAGIAGEAKTEAEKITAEAEKQAAEITAAAKAEAETDAGKIRAAAEKKAELIISSGKSSAELLKRDLGLDAPGIAQKVRAELNREN